MVRTMLAAWVVMAAIGGTAVAGSVKDAISEDMITAYNHGDYATAMRLLRPLADQGDATAQFLLGGMYEKGQGLPQDYAEAVRWYRKAADQGQPEAQFSLGTLYANGQGVPQDYVQAHKWLNLAASQPSSIHDHMVKNRNLVAAKMTPEQIAEAQALARKWKSKPSKHSEAVIRARVPR